MRKRLLRAALIVMIIGLPLKAYSDEKILIVRGDGDYPPHEMYMGDNLVGTHIDLINLCGQSLGIEITFKSVPWARAVEMVKQGLADAITYMGKTPEREQFAIFLEGNALSPTTNGFFVMKGMDKQIKYSGNLNELRGMTIGILRGYFYDKTFDNTNFLIKDEGADDEIQLITKLVAGRFNISLGNVGRIKYFIKELGFQNEIVFIKPYLPARNNYLAFSKKNDHMELALRFEEVMGELKRSPFFEKILLDYGLSKEDFSH